MVATQHGQTEVVRMLLSAGAQVNLQDNDVSSDMERGGGGGGRER